MKKILNKKQSGFALLVSIVLSTVMLSVMTLASKEMSDEARNSSRIDNSLVAYYAAEAGIEDALLSYRYNNDDRFSNKCKDIGTGNVVPCDNLTNLIGTKTKSYYYKNSISDINIDGGTKLYKDQVYEIPIKKETTGNFSISWITTNTNSNNGFRIETTAYLEDGTLLEKNISNASDSSANNSNSSRTISLGADSTKRKIIRVRTWYTSRDGGGGPEEGSPQDPKPYITLTLPTTSATIIKPTIRIDSTGYYGGVERKITMTLDKSSGNILGIFDYVIYSDQSLLK